MITIKIEEAIKARIGVAGALVLQAEELFNSEDYEAAEGFLYRASFLLAESGNLIDDFNSKKNES